jgi:cysteine synthase
MAIMILDKFGKQKYHNYINSYVYSMNIEGEIHVSKVAKTLTDFTGNTPLLELSNYNGADGLGAKVIAKLESFNPLSSVKDRIGYSLIEDGEERGLINKDTVLIEPTSGDTGIALAFVAAANANKGKTIVALLPDTGERYLSTPLFAEEQ